MKLRNKILPTLYVICFFALIPQSFAEEEPKETWKELSGIPEKRTSSAAVSLNEKIYVLGGLNNKDEETGTVFVYDPKVDSWNSGTAMPTSLHHMDAVTDGKKIYVVGGYAGNWKPSDKLLIYDSNLDSWEFGEKMPTARGALAAEFIDGKGICSRWIWTRGNHR